MESIQKKAESGFFKVVDRVVFAVFLVMAATIAFGLISNSGWYQERQTRKDFRDLAAKVQDAESIVRIEIDRLGSEGQVIYGVPEKLFDDFGCVGYSPVAEEERQREIFASDVVRVVYEDASSSVFHITEEGEIYWNYLKINCPSLVEWYLSYTGL